MKSFKMNMLNWMLSFVVVATVGGSMITLMAVPSVGAAPVKSCNQGFLGFPAWYRGLTKPYSATNPTSCDIKSPNDLNNAGAGNPSNGLSNFILLIGLNVLEMAVVAAAYLSGFYFLFGGWMFIISQGKPEGAAKARSIMTMAILGLVLTVSAVTLADFIFGKIGIK